MRRTVNQLETMGGMSPRCVVVYCVEQDASDVLH